MSNLGRAVFAKLKNTDLRRGKQPNISVFAVSAPRRFISMFHRSLSVLLNQLMRHTFQETTYPMEYLHQTACPYAGGFADTSHGKTIEVIHGDCIGDELVPIQAFGKYPGRLMPERLPTTATMSLGQEEKNSLRFVRRSINDAALFHSLVFEGDAALRTNFHLSLDFYDVIDR